MSWTLTLGCFILQYLSDIDTITNNYKSAKTTLIAEQLNLKLSKSKNTDSEKKEIDALLKNVQQLISASDTPYKITGISSNAIIYNFMRIVGVSIFSGIFSELFGHKITFNKIIKI